jgi:DNA-binding PadR family transcriptional regulator
VQAAEGNKKLYAATDAGRAVLKENSVILKAIFGRMEQAGRRFGRGRNPQIMRAMMNLKMALGMRAGRGDLNAEQVSKIAQAIDAAARAIDEA